MTRLVPRGLRDIFQAIHLLGDEYLWFPNQYFIAQGRTAGRECERPGQPVSDRPATWASVDGDYHVESALELI